MVLFSMPSSQIIIYLKILMVRLQTKGGSQYIQELLDAGSRRSYIQKSIVNIIKEFNTRTSTFTGRK